MSALPDPPSRTAVRTIMRILEEKGHLKHTLSGREFVYAPTRPRTRAGVSALRRVLDTFFDGSLEKALAAHLADPAIELSPKHIQSLKRLVQRARAKEE